MVKILGFLFYVKKQIFSFKDYELIISLLNLHIYAACDENK